DAVNLATGLAPRDVVAEAIAGGIGGEADATTKAAKLADIYASAGAVPQRFESTFFNGTNLVADDGTPSARVTARIDESTVISHGIQANDPAFTDLLRGLSMLASTDASEIDDPEAYRVWVGAAVEAVSAGVAGLIDTESRLGGQQKAVENVLQMQRDRHTLFNSQVLSLEGVGPLRGGDAPEPAANAA
ncbi:MAG: hypothetical protein LC676_19330, partial [Loktanella sp.]|nr:hypothetical protein [Loktanella sp.]